MGIDNVAYVGDRIGLDRFEEQGLHFSYEFTYLELALEHLYDSKGTIYVINPYLTLDSDPHKPGSGIEVSLKFLEELNRLGIPSERVYVLREAGTIEKDRITAPSKNLGYTQIFPNNYYGISKIAETIKKP